MDFFIPLVNTLALASLLIALVVSLVMAPWQVLLVLLILGLVSSQRLLSQIQRQSLSHGQAVQPQEASFKVEPLAKPNALNQVREYMLSYRGASYRKPSDTFGATGQAEAREVELSGKYRGSIWNR